MGKKAKTQKKSKSHSHKRVSHFGKIVKTKRKTKDIDQIFHDLKPDNAAKLLSQEVDQDLPGLGQHYCINCARYFTNDESLKAHVKTKLHKRQIKNLKYEPYTQEEANQAAGMGKYKKPNLTNIRKKEIKME